MRRPLRIVSVMEASTVTGVAKALLAFYKTARSSGDAEVSFVTFIRGTSRTNSYIEAIQALGFPIDVIRERGPLDLASIRRLHAIVGERAPDIVETHAVKSHVLLRLKRPPAKWVSFHHGYTHQDLKMRLYNALNPWALRRANRVITVCTPFRDELVKSGVPASSINIIPNAIAAPADTKDRTVTGRPGTILTIGRLSAEKGHRFLVEAIGILRDRCSDLKVQLILVGEGPERIKLERQVQQLALSEYVQFEGFQADLTASYGRASVFALPSLTEGSPLVLLEAMLARVPIVATSVGGVPETVRHEESALLVPAQQPQALADSIARLMADAELAKHLTANAYATVTTKHTPELYCESLLSVYHELTG